MGDLIEITTHARQPTSFYRVSSGALSFEVKALNAALVGLAKEPGNTCHYWFGFGQGGRLWIKGPDGLKTSNGGNYSLSQHQFRRFWIAWDCNTLRVGQSREIAYILSYPHTVTGLSYVTFNTQDIRHPAIWKFELSPASLIHITNNIPYKEIAEGELRWVDAEDVLPDNAVIGGFEAECIYIIRGDYNGSLTPGKFVPSEGVAYVSWGGAANVVPHFEILCGYNFKWVPTKNDEIPINAYVAGFSEDNHEKLYIGRVQHMNCVIPGKVQPTHKVCYVAFADKELAFKDYEILTIPGLNPYAAREYLETNINSAEMRHGLPMYGNHINHEAENADNDLEEEQEEEDSSEQEPEEDEWPAA